MLTELRWTRVCLATKEFVFDKLWADWRDFLVLEWTDFAADDSVCLLLADSLVLRGMFCLETRFAENVNSFGVNDYCSPWDTSVCKCLNVDRNTRFFILVSLFCIVNCLATVCVELGAILLPRLRLLKQSLGCVEIRKLVRLDKVGTRLLFRTGLVSMLVFFCL